MIVESPKKLYMCIYACICVYMCTYICVCIHMYVCRHIHRQVHGYLSRASNWLISYVRAAYILQITRAV